MTLAEQKQILKWIKIVVLRTLKEKNLTRLDVETLISAGMLGYAQARTRFDESRNVKFKTFAEYRIKGAVLDEVRKMIGDERAKTPRARRVEEYDYELISDDGDTVEHINQNLDIETLFEEAGLTSREIEIVRCRTEGNSIKEIAHIFQFSESRASQILFKIKKSFHSKLEAKFTLSQIPCPSCSGESLISDKSKEFRCDHCDVRLVREDGIVRLLEVIDEEVESD